MVELIHENYNIYSQALPKAGKERMGDSLLVRELPDENLLILTLADGVGSHVCDWFASETTCQVVCDSFAEPIAGRIADRLRLSIQRAHDRVRGETGKCAGAKSTLVAVVWEVNQDRFHYASIGDSRLYKHTAEGMLQLTKDDRASILATIAGETVLQAGMPVFIHGLTVSIGQPEPLEVDVRECEFAPGESLVLATDGMHGYGMFESDVEQELTKLDLGSSLPSLVQRHSAANDDDATLLILRRNDVTDEARHSYEEVVTRQLDYRMQGLFGHIMSAHLKRELTRAMDEGDSGGVGRYLDYAEKFRLLPDRAVLIELLSQMIKGGVAERVQILRLRRLIQTQHIN
jgi:serine/threonine protein phosphatase PrpC